VLAEVSVERISDVLLPSQHGPVKLLELLFSLARVGLRDGELVRPLQIEDAFDLFGARVGASG
jgi:hypothetical protein